MDSRSDPSAVIQRRGVLRFGTLVAALTGASTISALGTNAAAAATDTLGYVPVAEKGMPLGVATLGDDARIPAAQLPDISSTYATLEMANDFAAVRVDRLGAAKLAQSHALAIKAKADRVPMPASTTVLTANGQRAVIYLPKNLDRSIPVPLVIHYHGAGTDATSETQWQPLWEAAQAAGFAVATSDFHGNAYGSPEVMADTAAVFDAVLKLAPINGVLLSGESMGGISALNALTHNVLPNVLGIYLAQPVISLWHRYQNAGHDYITAAYGIAADGSDYATKTAGYDPYLQQANKFRGAPMYITGSTSDTTALVDPFMKGLIARLTGYSPTTFVAATGGHGDPSEFVPNNYVTFLESCAAGLVAAAQPYSFATDAVQPYNFTTDAALLSDFDGATLALSNGAAVTSWSPARGSKTTPLAQANASCQPSFTAVEASISNKPSVTFRGSSFLDTGDWSSAVSTPATIITVVKVDTAQPAQPFWTGRNGVYMYGGTSATGLEIGTASTGGRVSQASAGSQWRIVVSVYDGTNSRLYVNSKTAATGTTGTTADGPGAKLPGIKLNTTSGGAAGNGNNPRYARFAVIGRAITNSEAADVLDSLAATYGITLS
ncbi:hypothetical protein [Arthrobacter oryzae]|uniref:hypothetical protein n=1 Tax=Arthrobacter oryzae TaxID=409290 RepID=UPI0030C95E2D